MSIVRQAQTFPNLAVGVSSMNFPKREDSWRVVTLRVTATLGSLAGQQQITLNLVDGASNTIASWSAPFVTGASNVYNFTWSAAPVNSSQDVNLGSGMLYQIGIPEDVWVRPQWLAQVAIAPNDAADQLTSIQLQAEWYPAQKSVAAAKPSGQDTGP